MITSPDPTTAAVDRLAGVVSPQTLVCLIGSPFTVLCRLVRARDDEVADILSTVAAVARHLRQAGEHRAAAAYERVMRHWIAHELRRWEADDDGDV